MNTADGMRQLADDLRRKLGPAWARIVAYLRDNNKLADVQRRIEEGDFSSALEGITDAAAHFANEVAAAYKIAASATAGALDGQLDRLINFDETNHAAVAAVASVHIQTLQNVTEDNKQMVRALVEDGVANGDNPRVIAQDIRACIGLTDAQARYVTNFRRELESGDFTSALSRELVDGNHARTLARLARDGGGLTDAQVAAMVNAYSDNWITHRAETIARTEGLRAAHGGSDVMYRQAVDKGVIDAGDLIRTWKHTSRGRYSRDFHEEMQVGEVVGLDDLFVSGLGNELRYPCDPDAPPEETVNCRCVVVTRYRPNLGQRPVAGFRGPVPLAGG